MRTNLVLILVSVVTILGLQWVEARPSVALETENQPSENNEHQNDEVQVNEGENIEHTTALPVVEGDQLSIEITELPFLPTQKPNAEEEIPLNQENVNDGVMQNDEVEETPNIVNETSVKQEETQNEDTPAEENTVPEVIEPQITIIDGMAYDNLSTEPEENEATDVIDIQEEEQFTDEPVQAAQKPLIINPSSASVKENSFETDFLSDNSDEYEDYVGDLPLASMDSHEDGVISDPTNTDVAEVQENAENASQPGDENEHPAHLGLDDVQIVEENQTEDSPPSNLDVAEVQENAENASEPGNEDEDPAHLGLDDAQVVEENQTEDSPPSNLDVSEVQENAENASQPGNEEEDPAHLGLDDDMLVNNYQPQDVNSEDILLKVEEVDREAWSGDDDIDGFKEFSDRFVESLHNVYGTKEIDPDRIVFLDDDMIVL